MLISKNRLIFTALFVGIITSSHIILPLSASSEFHAVAVKLTEVGIIHSQSQSGYRLSDTITRAELAKVVANIGKYSPTKCVGIYSDVTPVLGDLCGYIEALERVAIIASAERFRPNDPVSRAEMVKMLLGAVGERGSTELSPYGDISEYRDLSMYITRANEIGCARTAIEFRPGRSSSRGETFKIAECVMVYAIGRDLVTISGEDIKNGK